MSSRASRGWRSAALLGALLWGACARQEAPAPAAPPSAAGPSAAAARASEDTAGEARAKLTEQPSRVEYVMPRAPVTAGAPAGAAPSDFTLGQSREDVVRLLGDCAERVHYLPGESGGLSVEIVQPKAGDCRQRLGNRRFTLTGGVLKEISPGALPSP